MSFDARLVHASPENLRMNNIDSAQKVTRIGTLNDEGIIELSSKGCLISNNFEKKNVRQTCYELRASNIYHDLSVDFRHHDIEGYRYILIKPKRLYVLMTLEELQGCSVLRLR
jgi:hypothetical protein